MNEIIIEVKNISKVYDEMTDNPVISLNNISMSIEKGEFICVMGTSGSGKTIIMVTHDVMVGSFASRLLYIQDGTIKEQLSRKEFKTQEDYFYNISKINSKEQLISLKK